MKNKILIYFMVLGVILPVLLSACADTNKSLEPNNVQETLFYRKVAREVREDGWVFTFVNNGYKDKNIDDSGLIRYQFFGINLRYKYDESFIQTQTQTTGKGSTITQTYVPALLIWGQGSDAQMRDMSLINNSILVNSHSVDDLLAMDPNDYSFEETDKDMFFRLMRKALTSEPQKEGTEQSYWDKPTYAFFYRASLCR